MNKPRNDDESRQDNAGLPDQPDSFVRTPAAPRQFGLGTLFVITAMYAVLFGVLEGFQVSPLDYIMVALLFTVVGLGRKLLYKGQQPLKASMIAGVCFFVGVVLVQWATYGIHDEFDLWNLLAAAWFGPLYGFLAGLLISGAFLFVDKAERLYGKCSGVQGAERTETSAND